MKKHFRVPVCAVLLASLLGSCRRGELPVKAHESGDVTTSQVDMDPLYKYQVYFNLRTGKEVGRNDKNVWDLGFETAADGYRVVLNGAASMFAMATTKSDFDQVAAIDTVGFGTKKKWDSYKGSLDSTAIGDWRVSSPVYVIDRGFDEKGKARGWVKFKMLASSPTSYSVRFAKLNGSDEKVVEIAKDSSFNFSYLSFTSGEAVTVEPPRETWDIAFTQYTYIFYDMEPPVPYLVTGCVLNRYNTSAYEDTVNSFEATNFGTIQEDRLSNEISAIGYDWKVFNGSKYTVRKNNYIVRDARGLYYKLHFTGFYNAAGTKGNPQWEYQSL